MSDPQSSLWSSYCCCFWSLLYSAILCSGADSLRSHVILLHANKLSQDFLRAAMTCITHFYQQGAQSYLDLASRLQFLFIAQEHMQAFLDPVKWGAVRHPAVSPLTPTRGDKHSSRQPDGGSAGGQGAAQMCMSKEDITRWGKHGVKANTRRELISRPQ